MNGKKRYKLAYIYKNTVIELQIPEEESKNCFLSKIDLFTMNFNNEYEILQYYKEYIKFNGIDEEKGYVSVIYKADGRLKQMDPIYKSRDYLEEYANEADTNVSIIKTKRLYQSIKTYLQDDNFIEFLTTNGLNNSRLHENIGNLELTKNNFFEQEVLKELSRYKSLRGILIGIDLFNRKKEDNNDFEIKELDLSDLIDKEDVIYNGRYMSNRLFEMYDLDDLNEDTILTISDSKKLKKAMNKHS